MKRRMGRHEAEEEDGMKRKMGRHEEEEESGMRRRKEQHETEKGNDEKKKNETQMAEEGQRKYGREPDFLTTLTTLPAVCKDSIRKNQKIIKVKILTYIIF